MRVSFALAIAVVLTSCVRFELFTCSDDDDCVLEGLAGQCEESGYCSFPDPDCPTGFRYSEHAPSELARQCVEPGVASGTTGGAETTIGESSAGESDGSETSAGPDCVDADGDGFGVGEACTGPDCDDDNPATADGCVYLGLDGDDANAGTREAPWRTFRHAISMLQPGDSLVVLDGTYEPEDGPIINVICGGEAVNGTADAPIFVRAENDRQVVLQGGGAAAGINLFECSYWRMRGFSIIRGDAPSDGGGEWDNPVGVGRSSQIELRQLFVSHTNRYFNEHAVALGDSEDILLEDVEVHDWHRSAFSIFRNNRVTCRRCYGHSHTAADLPECPDTPACDKEANPELIGTATCPFCSAGSPDRGDDTFYVEHSNDILFENSISDGAYRGWHIHGGTGIDGQPAGQGIRIVQSVSIDDDLGLEYIGDPGLTGMIVEDFVALSPRDAGVRVRDPNELRLSHVTVLGAAGDGVRLREATQAQCGSPGCSWSIDHSLVLGAGGDGLNVDESEAEWSLNSCNIFGSSATNYNYPEATDDPFDDDQGIARDNRSEDPSLVGEEADECRVYIPAGSSLSEAASDGEDIGANVTDRLVDGVSTGDPLWLDGGAFPCGPDPAAPAQIGGEQCPDLATRTGFGGACVAPDARG